MSRLFPSLRAQFFYTQSLRNCLLAALAATAVMLSGCGADNDADQTVSSEKATEPSTEGSVETSAESASEPPSQPVENATASPDNLDETASTETATTETAEAQTPTAEIRVDSSSIAAQAELGSSFNELRALDLAGRQLPTVEAFGFFIVEDSFAEEPTFSKQADELTGMLYEYKLKGEVVAISGGDYALTEALTRKAVGQLDAGDLATLIVVYVGSAEQQSSIEALFLQAGAELRFVVYTTETI